MSMRRATLIVPTRDHNEDLFACLKSISESVDAKVWNVRVIVVDDHSPKAARDGLIDRALKFNTYRGVTVKAIFMGRNVGFIRCCNAALEAIAENGCSYGRKPPDFIGVLHDDVRVCKGWLDELAAELDGDIDAYCAASMSNSEHDEHSIYTLKLKEVRRLRQQGADPGADRRRRPHEIDGV